MSNIGKMFVYIVLKCLHSHRALEQIVLDAS